MFGHYNVMIILWSIKILIYQMFSFVSLVILENVSKICFVDIFSWT